ncbi:MaoC family dehydratase N-terminal domain-containing protein [Piscinibacter sakaiensis]|uniref:FAS1-like dehydratase domain-containing protein n=1 Tax=Piscinibacter sakaiensis TaxID=1547922 RepID=UPI00372AAC5F
MDDRPDADLARLRDWIGRTETRGDEVGAPLWHWMFFNPAEPQHRLGPDGHPLRGGFLPPVPLPRRMWAGGRLSFHHPLRVGDELTRRSHIADVAVKHGRSGPLVFVTVRHEITNAQGLALTEEHDIVLLFRYSALTFNGHRIHYDRPYATGVEGYPGLVVHGPLIATLLLDLLRRERPDAVLRRFEFAARRPVFDQQPLELCGRPDGAGAWRLWARDHDGWLAMQARAELG